MKDSFGTKIEIGDFIKDDLTNQVWFVEDIKKMGEDKHKTLVGMLYNVKKGRVYKTKSKNFVRLYTSNSSKFTNISVISRMGSEVLTKLFSRKIYLEDQLSIYLNVETVDMLMDKINELLDLRLQLDTISEINRKYNLKQC